MGDAALRRHRAQAAAESCRTTGCRRGLQWRIRHRCPCPGVRPCGSGGNPCGPAPSRSGPHSRWLPRCDPGHRCASPARCCPATRPDRRVRAAISGSQPRRNAPARLRGYPEIAGAVARPAPEWWWREPRPRRPARGTAESPARPPARRRPQQPRPQQTRQQPPRAPSLTCSMPCPCHVPVPASSQRTVACASGVSSAAADLESPAHDPAPTSRRPAPACDLRPASARRRAPPTNSTRCIPASWWPSNTPVSRKALGTVSGSTRPPGVRSRGLDHRTPRGQRSPAAHRLRRRQMEPGGTGRQPAGCRGPIRWPRIRFHARRAHRPRTRHGGSAR